MARSGRSSQRKRQSATDKQMAKKNDGAPKSMVIRIGAQEVGGAVSQLVQDVRHVMEPDTAVRLKERRANKLKDYTTMCGPLGVSHLLLFSRSSSGNTNLRLARTPHGPTLHFRVDKYSLCKDIAKSLKHPRTEPTAFQTPPLLVMNNFLTSDTARAALGDAAPPKHLEKLVTDMFSGLFPPIQPHTTPLHTIKRVLLLHREPPSPETGTVAISLRHYAITTKVTGLPKALRRLHAAEKLIGRAGSEKKSKLPDLGKLEDVADYMLDPSAGGYTSASDTDADTDAEVDMAVAVKQRVLSRKAKERLAAGDESARRTASTGPRVEKRAVKLVELGPRMTLRLTKVDEDVCAGKTLWHEFITKTGAEQQALEKKWAARNAQRAERRRVQKENVERKKAAKAASGGAEGEEGEGDEDEVEGEEDSEMDYDEYDMDDDVWHDEDGAGAADADSDEDMEE
ncbi:Brix-domain-containing protein [Didymella exigua CBS 183.55]|uniref:Brix-domain-containing protein n=1 Tax=Didymella exigua CBS 183.55 TaxID=1150837 RepID=A0A6A5RYK6_9PLEO|nr:Brix-domain-containing protein [Didymella exigua CBS 183.55]KAF1932703.1 Brix-domain-containing protein [Didymella exigua CBS 183.55]